MKTEDLTSRFKRNVTVGIVSDTHGFLDPRIASIVMQCDIAVHLGDIGAQEVIDELKPKYGLVFAVVGNNDVPYKWTAADSESLKAIPAKCVIRLVVLQDGMYIITACQCPTGESQFCLTSLGMGVMRHSA